MDQKSLEIKAKLRKPAVQFFVQDLADRSLLTDDQIKN